MHDILNDIENFIFLSDIPERSDIIFIPGNCHAEPAEHAAGLWKQNYAPFLMPSGRFSITEGKFSGQLSGRKHYDGTFQTESEFISRILLENGVPEKAIIPENRSTFTYQNALCCRQILEHHRIRIRKAILCCMPVHARRCLMYYQTVFPECEFFICPAETSDLRADTWRSSPEGISQVLAELERCGGQFKDIFQEKQKFPDAPFPSPLEQSFLP